MSHSFPSPYRRWGATSPVVVVLLAGILLALVVLVVVLLMGRGPTPPGPEGSSSVTQVAQPPQTSGSAPMEKPKAAEPPVVNPGQQVNREDLPKPPKSPKLIGDEKRIKEVAREGKTYDMRVKAGFAPTSKTRTGALRRSSISHTCMRFRRAARSKATTARR